MTRIRRSRFVEIAPVDFLIEREHQGLSRWRKSAPRELEKKRLLLALWLRQIEEAERHDFLLIGPCRRWVRIDFP